MKTLTAFWHWVDNERPSEVLDKHLDPLTNAEQRAVGLACELVMERLEADFNAFDDDAMCDRLTLNGLREHWGGDTRSIVRGLLRHRGHA